MKRLAVIIAAALIILSVSSQAKAEEYSYEYYQPEESAEEYSYTYDEQSYEYNEYNEYDNSYQDGESDYEDSQEDSEETSYEEDQSSEEESSTESSEVSEASVTESSVQQSQESKKEESEASKPSLSPVVPSSMASMKIDLDKLKMSTYNLTNVDMFIDIPKDMNILKRGMTADDPALKKLGIKKDEAEEMLLKSDSVIKAFADDFSYDITVSYVKNKNTERIGNLSALTDKQIQQIIDNLLSNKYAKGCAQNRFNNVLFLTVNMEYEDENGSKINGIQQYTVVNDANIIITLQVKDAPITNDMRAMFHSKVMSSVFFENIKEVSVKEPEKNIGNMFLGDIDRRYWLIIGASIIAAAALAGIIIVAIKRKETVALERGISYDQLNRRYDDDDDDIYYDDEDDESVDEEEQEEVLYSSKEKAAEGKSQGSPAKSSTSEIAIPKNPYTPVGKAEAVAQPAMSVTSEIAKFSIINEQAKKAAEEREQKQTEKDDTIVFAESSPKPKTSITQIGESVLDRQKAKNNADKQSASNKDENLQEAAPQKPVSEYERRFGKNKGQENPAKASANDSGQKIDPEKKRELSNFEKRFGKVRPAAANAAASDAALAEVKPVGELNIAPMIKARTLRPENDPSKSEGVSHEEYDEKNLAYLDEDVPQTEVQLKIEQPQSRIIPKLDENEKEELSAPGFDIYSHSESSVEEHPDFSDREETNEIEDFFDGDTADEDINTEPEEADEEEISEPDGEEPEQSEESDEEDTPEPDEEEPERSEEADEEDTPEPDEEEPEQSEEADEEDTPEPDEEEPERSEEADKEVTPEPDEEEPEQSEEDSESADEEKIVFASPEKKDSEQKIATTAEIEINDEDIAEPEFSENNEERDSADDEEDDRKYEKYVNAPDESEELTEHSEPSETEILMSSPEPEKHDTAQIVENDILTVRTPESEKEPEINPVIKPEPAVEEPVKLSFFEKLRNRLFDAADTDSIYETEIEENQDEEKGFFGRLKGKLKQGNVVSEPEEETVLKTETEPAEEKTEEAVEEQPAQSEEEVLVNKIPEKIELDIKKGEDGKIIIDPMSAVSGQNIPVQIKDGTAEFKAKEERIAANIAVLDEVVLDAKAEGTGLFGDHAEVIYEKPQDTQKNTSPGTDENNGSGKKNKKGRKKKKKNKKANVNLQPDESIINSAAAVKTEPEPETAVKAEPEKPEPETVVKADPEKPQPETAVKADPEKPEPETAVKAEPEKPEPETTVKSEPEKPEPETAVKAEPEKPEPETAIKAEPEKPEPETAVKAEPEKPEPETAVKAEPEKPEPETAVKAEPEQSVPEKAVKAEDEKTKTDKAVKAEKSKTSPVRDQDKKPADAKPLNKKSKKQKFNFERDAGILFEHPTKKPVPPAVPKTGYMTVIPSLESVNADEYNKMFEKYLSGEAEVPSLKKEIVEESVQKADISAGVSDNIIKPEKAVKTKTAFNDKTSVISEDNVEDLFDDDDSDEGGVTLKSLEVKPDEGIGTKLKKSFGKLFTAEDDEE